MQNKTEPAEPRRDELSDEELNTVVGGSSAIGNFFQILSNIVKAQSETAQQIVRNIRG